MIGLRVFWPISCGRAAYCVHGVSKPDGKRRMTLTVTPVISSNIHTIGYDPETKKLHVTFKGSGTYIYHGVSPEHHEALMASDSKGRYLGKHIVGRYPHLKDK